MICSKCGTKLPEKTTSCPNCGKIFAEPEMAADFTIEMVDFFKESQYIISLGLASSPGDINKQNWYRIKARDPRLARPENILRLKNSRVICDGKIEGLGCNGVVYVTNPQLPSPEGHLLLNMKGPLDAPSKCMVTCSCGSSYMLYADATHGKPGECYLVVITTSYPATRRLTLRPFFETDGVDIFGKPGVAETTGAASSGSKMADPPHKPSEEAAKSEQTVRKGCLWKLVYGTGLALLIFGFLLFLIPQLDRSTITIAGYYLYPIISSVIGILLMYLATHTKKPK